MEVNSILEESAPTVVEIRHERLMMNTSLSHEIRRETSCLYTCFLGLCLLMCDVVPTGAVGLPLPGVEVRIAMNNTTNTTIVEGNHRDTQVIPERIKTSMT